MLEEKENNQISTKESFEENQNLFGFFDLLLKVDMRNNPENYKKEDKEE
jgi:hypothetical protein